MKKILFLLIAIFCIQLNTNIIKIQDSYIKTNYYISDIHFLNEGYHQKSYEFSFAKEDPEMFFNELVQEINIHSMIVYTGINTDDGDGVTFYVSGKQEDIEQSYKINVKDRVDFLDLNAEGYYSANKKDKEAEGRLILPLDHSIEIRTLASFLLEFKDKSGRYYNFYTKDEVAFNAWIEKISEQFPTLIVEEIHWDNSSVPLHNEPYQLTLPLIMNFILIFVVWILYAASKRKEIAVRNLLGHSAFKTFKSLFAIDILGAVILYAVLTISEIFILKIPLHPFLKDLYWMIGEYFSYYLIGLLIIAILLIIIIHKILLINSMSTVKNTNRLLNINLGVIVLFAVFSILSSFQYYVEFFNKLSSLIQLQLDKKYLVGFSYVDGYRFGYDVDSEKLESVYDELADIAYLYDPSGWEFILRFPEEANSNYWRFNQVEVNWNTLKGLNVLSDQQLKSLNKENDIIILPVSYQAGTGEELCRGSQCQIVRAEKPAKLFYFASTINYSKNRIENPVIYVSNDKKIKQSWTNLKLYFKADKKEVSQIIEQCLTENPLAIENAEILYKTRKTGLETICLQYTPLIIVESVTLLLLMWEYLYLYVKFHQKEITIKRILGKSESFIYRDLSINICWSMIPISAAVLTQNGYHVINMIILIVFLIFINFLMLSGLTLKERKDYSCLRSK